jgi:hypothetical protein
MPVGTPGIDIAQLRKQGVKFIETNLPKKIKEMELRKLFATGKMTTEYVESRTQETSGSAIRQTDGSVKSLITLKDGYAKRKTAFWYEIAGQFTRRDKILNKKEQFARMVNAIMKALIDVQEITCANFIEYGDTVLASVPTVNNIPLVDPIAGDGLPVFSRSHTFASDAANTYNTKTASFLDATHDNLYDIINEIRLWEDENGVQIMADVESIVTGQNNEQQFAEMFKSTGRSDTMNHVTNILPSYFGRDGVKTYRKMVNPNEWGIKTNLVNDYECLNIEEAHVLDWYDDKTEILGYNGHNSFAVGCNEPRGLYFNKA